MLIYTELFMYQSCVVIIQIVCSTVIDRQHYVVFSKNNNRTAMYVATCVMTDKKGFPLQNKHYPNIKITLHLLANTMQLLVCLCFHFWHDIHNHVKLQYGEKHQSELVHTCSRFLIHT